jgi:predicted small secreted protein
MKTLAIVIMVAVLSACNTVAGLGTDINRSAVWTKEQMKPKTDLNQK